MNRRLLTVSLQLVVGLGVLSLATSNLDAQVVQLPTLRFFNVRTVVSVPDAGRSSLGRVRRSSTGILGRGVPGVRGVPVVGRGFGNRAIGGTTSAGGSTVSAQVIVMKDYEKRVMQEARGRRAAATAQDPNGTAAIQKKADFMTRNMGRSRKR